MLAALAVAASACSDEDPATDATPPSFTLASTTTTEPPATTLPSDTVVTTTPPPEPPVTDAAVTTTTEPLAVQELVLRGDGIGSARFGAAPEGVIEYVQSVLGAPTGDTGWVDPFAFADCGAGGAATVARRVDWGVLSLLFSDASSYAIERPHFMGYEYGRVGTIGDEPVGLRTQGSTTLGTRVVDLYAEFPEASVNEGDEAVGIPPNFYVSDVFYGLLTGATPDDVVTVVFAGYGCGEF